MKDRLHCGLVFPLKPSRALYPSKTDYTERTESYDSHMTHLLIEVEVRELVPRAKVLWRLGEDSQLQNEPLGKEGKYI